jgi:hypothetical protein
MRIREGTIARSAGDMMALFVKLLEPRIAING